MRLRTVSLLVAALALAGGAQFTATQPGVEIPQTLSDRVAAGERVAVIVGVETGFMPEGDLAGPAAITMQREAIQRGLDDVIGRAAAAGVEIGRRFSTIPFFGAKVDAGELAALASMPGVTSISEVVWDKPLLTQSVPLIGATTSHTAGFTGAGWMVAILDTGVDKAHAFLSGKVPHEACYSSNDAGLGVVSVCPGGATSSTAAGSGVPCSASLSGCEHGTHVAGIAAGKAGVSGAPTFGGVAPGANIIAIQVFSRINNAAICSPEAAPCIRTSSLDYTAGLERVLQIAGAGNVNQVAAANMSLGGAYHTAFCDTSPSSMVPVKAAIDNLLSIGIATAIATGNDGDPTGIGRPACISSAISVGSTTKSDEVSDFSNRRAGLVDLMAPGGDNITLAGNIRSSVPGGTYDSFAGTSMATPHVAGAWAVLKQAAPGATVAQVLSALQSTGQPINDAFSDWAGVQAVYPRINVNAARLALGGSPGGAPGAPGTPTISGSGNNVTISWTAPTTGGAPTGYTLIARGTCGGAIITSIPVAGLSFSTPAPNGTFCVSVRASNAQGTGPESAGTSFSVPILPAAPGAPTGLAASVAGSTVNFTWNAPASGGAVAQYLLVASMSPGGSPIATLPLSPAATGATVNSVPGGTYFVRLFATNLGGQSPASNEVTVNVAGPQPPGAPSLGAATVGPGRLVTLNWTQGGGGTPTTYTVLARTSPSGPIVATVGVGGTTLQVNAPPGTFFVTVVASNGLGTSAESNQITVVVP